MAVMMYDSMKQKWGVGEECRGRRRREDSVFLACWQGGVLMFFSAFYSLCLRTQSYYKLLMVVLLL
jgi:hypothetical protein